MAQEQQNPFVNPIQVQKYLKGIDYPVQKDDLIRAAEDNGADNNLIAMLENLPMNEFNSPNDVSEAIGKMYM
jgi:hypothetical protein